MTRTDLEHTTNEVIDALTWAVLWMERYEGQTTPEWREWAARGRATLSAAAPSEERAP